MNRQMYRAASSKLIIASVLALSILACLAVVGLTGCGGGGGGAGGILNQLDRLPDTDGDGFPEIEPPPGVEFDAAGAVALKMINTITRSQAEAAAGVSLPSAVASQVSVTVQTAVTLVYADGTEQVLRGTFPLGPREIAFEAACPDYVEVLVTAMADTPVTAPQAVQTFGPFIQTLGEDSDSYACGGIISLETSTDAAGELVASIVIE